MLRKYIENLIHLEVIRDLNISVDKINISSVGYLTQKNKVKKKVLTKRIVGKIKYYLSHELNANNENGLYTLN